LIRRQEVVTSGKPIKAFLSYVRFDNRVENDYIARLCRRLREAVEQHSGVECQIFQDVNDIGWGEQWKSKIERSLSEAYFLIPIVTPKFLQSQSCREEVELFRKRERALGRNDLILPIHFIDCEVFHDERALNDDSIARLIYSRQSEDWRELRYHGLQTAMARRALDHLAVQIVAASRPPGRGSGAAASSSALHLLFPHFERYLGHVGGRSSATLMIVSGMGRDQKLSNVRFPGPGAVKTAQAGLAMQAFKAGLSDRDVMFVDADRDFSKLDMSRAFVCSIASPAVNPYTRRLLDEVMSSSPNGGQISFLVDNYPQEPVRLAIDERLLGLADLSGVAAETYTSDCGMVVLRPQVTPDKLAGVDYGLLVRRVGHEDETPHVQIVMAGCRNYGTWAAYFAATEDQLIDEILERAGLVVADLEAELTLWALVRGIGRGGSLAAEDVTVLAGGVLEASLPRVARPAPVETEVVNLEIMEYTVKHLGYLFFGQASMRNVYQNRDHSASYDVSFVFKDGYDSVAVLLYFVKGRHVFVGTIENLRPALHARKMFNLPSKDRKEYVYFQGIIAGALEHLEGQGESYIDQRAVQEIAEESGFRADPQRLVNLGSYFVSPGYCIERMHLRAYELEDFQRDQVSGDGTLYEEGIRVMFREAGEVLSLFSPGIIEDPKTEIAVRRLCAKIGYIPEIHVWCDDLQPELRAKYRRLFP
jgi:hypothetical protein